MMMHPAFRTKRTVGNGAARFSATSPDNEPASHATQTNPLVFSTTGDFRWSPASFRGISEKIEGGHLPGSRIAFDDGLISMLDDGQIPQQLFSDEIAQYLDTGEADLRANLLRLLSQLQAGGGRMAAREDADAGWVDEQGEEVIYFDPLAQYRDPTAESQVPFPLTDPSNSNSLPVTCTFGTMRDGRLSFVSQDFRWFEASHFPDALNSQAESSAGLIFLTITNWQPWFLANLKSAVPNFPVQSILHLNEDNPATMLPVMDKYLSEMSCITEHVDMAMIRDNEIEDGLPIGLTRTKRRPLAVWTAARDGLPHHSQRPLVIVASKKSEGIVSKIAGYYVQVKNGQVSHIRWERMRGNQSWVYLDLYNMFTQWDKVWEAVKNNLNGRVAEMHNGQPVTSKYERARQLYFDNDIMITLREQLRAHKASLKVLIRRTNEPSELQYWQSSEILSARLDDALQSLEFYDELASSLLKQQKNLLGLSSTLECASRGQTIASFYTLALVFLPLSLVASIFSIHTITVSPKYIPAAAVPAMVITIGIAYLAHKFSSEHHNQSQPADLLPSDIEKFPNHHSVSTFNYPNVQGEHNPWYMPRNLVRLIFLPHTTNQNIQSSAMSTSHPAPAPHVPMSHNPARMSFQSTHLSSSPHPYGTNRSTQLAGGDSLPRLPHLPTINPLWPSPTFPTFDQGGNPTRDTTSPTPLPVQEHSEVAPALRELSTNITIRKSSRSPSREVIKDADIHTSARAITALETSFPPSMSAQQPRSHVAYQIAEGHGSASAPTQQVHSSEQSGTSESRNRADEPMHMIIARGMGDITDSESETETVTRRSSSELSPDEQIDYRDIARRQAEAYGFGVGFASGSTIKDRSPLQRQFQTPNLGSEASPMNSPLTSPLASPSSFGTFFGEHKVLRPVRSFGHVGKLVSRFESGSAIGTTPETQDGGPIVSPITQPNDPVVSALGIYNPEDYNRAYDNGHVDLYNAEDDDYRPPRQIKESQRVEVTESPKQHQRSSHEPPLPIPPRNSSHFANIPNISLRSASNSHLPLTESTTPTTQIQNRSTERAESSSSYDTAVTARIRPQTKATSSRSQETLSVYDSDGFYVSPAGMFALPARPAPAHTRDEHAEHPGGLEERGVLDLMEDEGSVRTSWVEDQRLSATWREVQRREEREARRSEDTGTGTETDGEDEGGRTSSEVETSDIYDEDDEGEEEGTMVNVQRASGLLTTAGLGPAGTRASVASGGSYTMGYLDTIPE